MHIQAIVAFDKDFGIAKNGKIPWKSLLDILFFRYMTFGNIVIMGYSTFISLPNGPLDNRLNIVLTKKPLSIFNTNKQHLLFMNNIQDIFDFLHTTDFTTNPLLSTNFQIFIIGGKQIYELFYPYIDTFWVSQINEHFYCDVVFHWDFFLTQFSIQKNVLTNYEISIDKYTKIK
jgi:dihydrofolate reductase